MDTPRRDPVLSIDPTRRGQWEVRYGVGQGIQTETFSSHEAALEFSHGISRLVSNPLVSAEPWSPRRINIELQTKRIQEDRRSSSKFWSRSALLVTTSSIVATVVAISFIIVGGSQEISDLSLFEGFSLLLSGAVLIFVNILNLYILRKQRRIEQKLLERQLTREWAARAWAAASSDIHIQSPKPTASLWRDRSPNVDMESTS